MTLRPLVTGLLAASTLIVVSASPALAECMTWPRHATERLQVGYAFSGTVVDVAKSLYSEEGSPLYRWVVSVDVEHVYRGRVPERVQLEGTDWGCSFLRVSSLADGDRVFIASERLRPALTDETDLGNVLAWKHTGGRWVFHDHGLQEGSDPDYYPAAARTAKTTRDIARLISGATLPDTSTESLDRRSNLASLPLLGVIFASSLGLLLLRRSRRA